MKKTTGKKAKTAVKKPDPKLPAVKPKYTGKRSPKSSKTEPVEMVEDDLDQYYNDINEVKKKEIPRDKIFGNDFNTGNLKSDHMPNIKIETSFSSSYLDDCYDAEEYAVRKDLMKKVYEAFTKSQWSNLTLDKKFPKELMPYIFNDIYKSLADDYPTVDIFICIAEFMDVSYEKVYEIVGIKVKERLLNELEVKYKVLSRRKINRLF